MDIVKKAEISRKAASVAAAKIEAALYYSKDSELLSSARSAANGACSEAEMCLIEAKKAAERIAELEKQNKELNEWIQRMINC